MNFPDNLLFAFLYWLINTPGLGGIIVGMLGVGMMLSVGLTLRWIVQGGELKEPEEYAYPTPALHSDESER
jgi:hypothetical protein